MSHDQTWTAGQVLTAAALNDLTSGRVGSASVTATQGSITTVTDVTSLTLTWTAIASRYYRIIGQVGAFSSVADDRIELAITDGSNTQIAGNITTNRLTSVCSFITVIATVAPGAGSVTYKLRMLRVSGTGNITMHADSARPASIWVEDFGSA